MHDLLYLHGFGETNPENCPVARALQRTATGIKIHVPCYHPQGRVSDTRIGQSLALLVTLIDQTPTHKVHLVGYSFGGLLAAILAATRPELVTNVLLLAPAIDNYARNYEGCDPARWHMPRAYVEELRTYPARPAIIRPTSLVHGLLDVDRAGSAPWRVQQWVDEQRALQQPFRSVHFLREVDHSLEPWLSGPHGSCGISSTDFTFQQALTELFAE